MKQGIYIVVSENEIVKAEMERPDEKDYTYGARDTSGEVYDIVDQSYAIDIGNWRDHCLSLPRIPIQGKHNWKVWQEVKEGKDFYLMNTDKWYWCKCEKCGWEGSSQLCKGGGPIADTGDYDDALCPECMSNDLDGETDNGPEDYTGIVAIQIEQTKSEQGGKPNCSVHKRDLFGQTDMKVVAEAIGDLHYETLAELLGRLGVKLYKDGLKDRMTHREQLGYALNDAGEYIDKAALLISKAWKISKPFMVNSEQNPERSVATEADQGTEAGKQNL